ncbi:hypothetical protein [Nocardioides sp.]|uniref:hypothetical protein n=1 Tax=Nocardioides sp. TaxID=35761 RepID=UPI002B27BAFC|nr:hypothetical protein [Nocardioides sp.]
MTDGVPRHHWRTLLSVAAVALGLLAVSTDATRSAWTAGVVGGTSTARSGELAFSHAYQATACSTVRRVAGSQACSASLAPALGATAAGVSAVDTITNYGTLGADDLKGEVRAASCAPVKLDNRVAGANPLLPRYGATFSPTGGPMTDSGFVTLDGGAPGGYATSAASSTQPGGSLLSSATVAGIGVWFKAAPGTTGPLFSFGTSPANGTGAADRALSLDATGKLRFVWNVAGSTVTSTASGYADGLWHFAYVTLGGLSVLGLGLLPRIQLWVDGVQQADVTGALLSSFSSYPGHWHLGYAPTSVTGLGTAYVKASLSNFVVLSSGSIPSGSTLGKPTTQTAFNTATSNATDHWLLADSGTTTFDDTLPATMSAPCSKVNISWSFTGPAASPATDTPLSSFADNTWRQVGAPAPGASQVATLTIRRGVGYTTDLSGLRLHVPLSHRAQSRPVDSAWTQTFTWSGAESAVIG